MGRVRERPRLVAAQVLVVVAIAVAGVLVGMALKGDKTKVPVATQQRLDRAERSARTSAAPLKTARADAGKAHAAAARAGRRSRALARANRRLRADLRRARRAALKRRR
jgi:hypothetical protein